MVTLPRNMSWYSEWFWMVANNSLNTSTGHPSNPPSEAFSDPKKHLLSWCCSHRSICFDCIITLQEVVNPININKQPILKLWDFHGFPTLLTRTNWSQSNWHELMDFSALKPMRSSNWIQPLVKTGEFLGVTPESPQPSNVFSSSAMALFMTWLQQSPKTDAASVPMDSNGFLCECAKNNSTATYLHSLLVSSYSGSSSHQVSHMFCLLQIFILSNKTAATMILRSGFMSATIQSVTLTSVLQCHVLEKLVFLIFSPPRRWGLLEFITAVLLLLLLLLLLLANPLRQLPHQSSSPSFSPILFASFWSQWALLDLNCQLRIAVGIPGPQPPAYPSGHPWTSTASVVSQWAPLDLNRQLPISVGTPWPQRPDFITKHCHKVSSQNIITKHHDKTSSQSIITKHHHKASSQSIITIHHHKTSSQNIITNHYHRSFSQDIITIHHHKASSQIIITDHFHKASSQYIITKYDHKTLSQNIITKHLHKASSQYIITKHHHRPSSSQSIITNHYHRSFSQNIITIIHAVTCHYKTTLRNSSNTMIKCHGGDHSK